MPTSDTDQPTDRPLDPRESLNLIEEQELRAKRSYEVNPTPFYLAWGAAYFVGSGAVYAAHPRGLALFPMPVAYVVLAVLIVGAFVVSAVRGARSGRGIRGQSQVEGAMYGLTWPIAFGALTAVNTTVTERFGLSGEANQLLWTGTALVLIGALYMVSGALWHESTLYVLGVVMLLGAALSVLTGVPTNYLVLSLLVGGGLLVLAAYYGLRKTVR